MADRDTIGVIGAGAFGTALACVLSKETEGVSLYGRDAGQMQGMRESRSSPRITGVELPLALSLESAYQSLGWHKTLLLVVPSAAQVAVAEMLSEVIAMDAAVVMCAKGLDRESGDTITRRLGKVLPGRQLAVLSGPGFAADIARGLPTAMTLAAADMAAAEELAGQLSRKSFRLYASDDPIGVQLGGALKNVLAIAAGIVIGAGLGESARAALIARGLAELTRWVIANGGRRETAAGLSGLGDLVLTATSEQSRNYRFGLAIGKGAALADLTAAGQPLVEGAGAAVTAAKAARDRDIAMPVTEAVAAIVTGKADVATVVDQLLSRPLRSETA